MPHPRRAMHAGVVHQNATHHLRSNADEVGPTVPVDVLVSQPQISFLMRAVACSV